MEQNNKSPSVNVLNSKNIVVIREFDCLPMTAQSGDCSIRFVIGQDVVMLVQYGDTVNFKCGGEYFSAPSYCFVTKSHWNDITKSIIRERSRRKAISVAKGRN